jgi:hypothetical protein
MLSISITIFVLFFILGLIISFSNFKPTYVLYGVNDLILTRLVGVVLVVASGFMIYSMYLGNIAK